MQIYSIRNGSGFYVEIQLIFGSANKDDILVKYICNNSHATKKPIVF